AYLKTTIYISRVSIPLYRSGQRASGMRGESVLLQVEPDKFQLFRTVVEILNGDRTGKGMVGRIQLNFNLVICFVLPVFWAGFAGSRPVLRTWTLQKFTKYVITTQVLCHRNYRRG